MTQNILENCYDQEPRGKSRFIYHSRVWKVDLTSHFLGFMPRSELWFLIRAQGRYFLIRRKHSCSCLLSLVTLVTPLMGHNSSFARTWRGQSGHSEPVSIETDELWSSDHDEARHWLRSLGLCLCQGNPPSQKWIFSRGCTEQIVNTIILLLNPSLDYGNWSLQGISELLNCRLLVFKLKLISGWTVSASNQLLDNSRFNI